MSSKKLISKLLAKSLLATSCVSCLNCFVSAAENIGKGEEDSVQDENSSYQSYNGNGNVFFYKDKSILNRKRERESGSESENQSDNEGQFDSYSDIQDRLPDPGSDDYYETPAYELYSNVPDLNEQNKQNNDNTNKQNGDSNNNLRFLARHDSHSSNNSVDRGDVNDQVVNLKKMQKISMNSKMSEQDILESAVFNIIYSELDSICSELGSLKTSNVNDVRKNCIETSSEQFKGDVSNFLGKEFFSEYSYYKSYSSKLNNLLDDPKLLTKVVNDVCDKIIKQGTTK